MVKTPLSLAIALTLACIGRAQRGRATLALKNDIERALKRLPAEFVENFSGTEGEVRWVENYIKLNPRGLCP